TDAGTGSAEALAETISDQSNIPGINHPISPGKNNLFMSKILSSAQNSENFHGKRENLNHSTRIILNTDIHIQHKMKSGLGIVIVEVRSDSIIYIPESIPIAFVGCTENIPEV